MSWHGVVIVIPWIVTLAFPARLGMATDSPPANIYRHSHNSVGVAWEHYQLTFLCLESILAKIKDCTGMGCPYKGSFCWEYCLKISSPKTRKCHCAAQMDNSAHNTPNYPSNSVLRICPEVSISLHTRNSIYNVPKSWGLEEGIQYPSHNSHSEQSQNLLCQHQRAHIFTPQLELQPQAICSSPWEGKVAGMVALPPGKPSQKYQISTQTLLSMFKMQVTVVSQ